MARISNIIEEFIKHLINEAETGEIEIKRNELANKFECAPSQINYVLTTRFTSEKGYYIESRRGGGGYIKIFKTDINNDKHIKNMVSNIIGDSLTNEQCNSIIKEFIEEEVISLREARIMRAAINDRLLNSSDSEKEIRASIFKSMLLVLIGGD
ncbi:MAG: CtsR family transcriptional regulator [Andreesenia angusta]|nr:CtsR family transcriptional regulator [Andreesenia angusta]